MQFAPRLPPGGIFILKSSNRRSGCCGDLRLLQKVPTLFHPAEIGAHLIGQAGQPVQELGIVLKHFIVLGLLVDNVVVDLAPALLKKRPALDLDIVSLIFDDIVQGAVNAVGNDLQLLLSPFRL